MAQGQVTGWPPTSCHRHPETPTDPPGSRLTPPIREGKRKALKFNYSPVHEGAKLARSRRVRGGREQAHRVREEVRCRGEKFTAQEQLAQPKHLRQVKRSGIRPEASQADGQGQP